MLRVAPCAALFVVGCGGGAASLAPPLEAPAPPISLATAPSGGPRYHHECAEPRRDLVSLGRVLGAIRGRLDGDEQHRARAREAKDVIDRIASHFVSESLSCEAFGQAYLARLSSDLRDAPFDVIARDVSDGSDLLAPAILEEASKPAIDVPERAGAIQSQVSTKSTPPTTAEDTMAKLRPEFRACYNDALRRGAGWEGAATITVHLRETGAVDLAEITTLDGLDAGAAECIRARIAGAMFPPPTKSTRTLVVPVKFKR